MSLSLRSLRRWVASRTRLQSRLASSSSARGIRAIGGYSRPSIYAGLGAGVLLGGSLFVGSTTALHADAETKQDEERHAAPLSSLVRAYVVYAMCSVPFLVDCSPTLISLCSSIPGVKHLTEALIRVTFFNQFVGGDTAEDCLPLLERYSRENKGVLFAYSVEVDENENEASGALSKQGRDAEREPPHRALMKEMVHCIDVAADFEDKQQASKGIDSRDGQGRKTWVAIKLTALLPDAQALRRFSQYLIATRPHQPDIPFPGVPHPADLDVLDAGSIPADCHLTQEDLRYLRELHTGLIGICQRAKERGVRIIIDAEHSWYQPAIDAYVLSLTRQFNKSSSPQPLIYQSYQCYLRRTPLYLAHSIREATLNNYSLGIKLVRGAYHDQEARSHPTSAPCSSSSSSLKTTKSKSLSISPDPHPPVWLNKAETDQCYNDCARTVIASVHSDMHERVPQNAWRLGFKLWGYSKDDKAPGIGVLFGSHNWTSCNMILDELVQRGLAQKDKDKEKERIQISKEVTGRVTFGQLYGMADDLTDYIAQLTKSSEPMVIKYVPYGALSEVMPYLSRRAIENKSVLGNGTAEEERRRAWKEMRGRIFGTS